MHLRYPQCWRVLFLLLFFSNLPVSFLRCKAFCIVINFRDLVSICLRSFLVHFKHDPEYLTRGDCLSVSSFDPFPATEFRFENFSCSSDIFFRYFFIHLSLFDGVRYHVTQVLVIFLFSNRSDVFLTTTTTNNNNDFYF